MVRILVTPERLEDMSRQMAQAASSLRGIEGHLGRALGGLDWQVRQQANVEGQVNAARGQARALAEQAEAMARYLADRAQAFLQADAEGAQNLGAVTAPYLRPVPTPVPAPLPSGPSTAPSLESFIHHLDDLLKPIDWTTSTRKAERQFFKSLEKLGRWLNTMTGQRGHIKLLKDLGEFLRDTSKGLGKVATILDAWHLKQYFDGQMTNREIAEVAINVIVGFIMAHIGVPLAPAVATTILASPLTQWMVSNMVNPDGHWHGPLGPVGE